jgi:hypothetical protein
MPELKLAILKDGEYFSEISGNEALFAGMYHGYNFRCVYSFETGKWKFEDNGMPEHLLNELKWEMYSRNSWLPKQDPPNPVK